MKSPSYIAAMAASVSIHAGGLLLLSAWVAGSVSAPVQPQEGETFTVLVMDSPLHVTQTPAPAEPALAVPEPPAPAITQVFLPKIESLPSDAAEGVDKVLFEPPPLPENVQAAVALPGTAQPFLDPQEKVEPTLEDDQSSTPLIESSPQSLDAMLDFDHRPVTPTFLKQPKYPLSARRHGREGTVAVSVLLGPAGTCHETLIIEGSGTRALDKAALKAARASRFHPASRFGVPVSMRDTIAFTFRLSEE